MDRIYNVWTSTDRTTKKITRYFISDLTEDEANRKISRPRIAEFLVSEIADDITQRKMAIKVCHLLNGYITVEPTDKGLEMRDKFRTMQKQKEKELEKAVDPKIIAAAEKETLMLLNKIRSQSSSKKYGIFGKFLKWKKRSLT